MPEYFETTTTSVLIPLRTLLLSQNSQAHFKNLAALAAKFLNCVLVLGHYALTLYIKGVRIKATAKSKPQRNFQISIIEFPTKLTFCNVEFTNETLWR